MRRSQIIGMGLVVAGLVQGGLMAKKQDADKKVAGGGIHGAGMDGQGRHGEQAGLTVKDSKLRPRARATADHRSGGVMLERQERQQGRLFGQGDVLEPKQAYNHRILRRLHRRRLARWWHRQRAVLRGLRNGNYIIRGFSGGKRFDIVPKPVPNDAVKAAGPEAEVVQEVGWNVKGDSVECVINGTSVWKARKRT